MRIFSGGRYFVRSSERASESAAHGVDYLANLEPLSRFVTYDESERFRKFVKSL